MESVEQEFWNNPEPLIATMARLYAVDGMATEVAILAHSKVSIRQTSYDNWDGGISGFTMYLGIPMSLWGQISSKFSEYESELLSKAQYLTRGYAHDKIEACCITPEVSATDDWREKAKSWLAGDGVTNQGRVRSNNVAPKSVDGLLFRSDPEVYLYRALKALGVSFAPLPVFIRGGQDYRRIEPDFVVIKEGIVLIIEVDGDTVHTETPAEAHARVTMLQHEGAFVERVRASECNSPEKATVYASKIVELIAKLKAARS